MENTNKKMIVSKNLNFYVVTYFGRKCNRLKLSMGLEY